MEKGVQSTPKAAFNKFDSLSFAPHDTYRSHLIWPLTKAEKSSKWALNFSYAILGSQDLEAKIRPSGRVKIKISMEISTRGGGGQTRPPFGYFFTVVMD